MIVGILDDNPAICQLFDTFLTFAGYEVYAYTNASAFVAAFSLQKIDSIKCIIVDFHLGEQRTGAEIIREMQRQYFSLPAILISASSLPETTLSGLRNVKALQKPFSLQMRLTTIAQVQPQSLFWP